MKTTKKDLETFLSNLKQLDIIAENIQLIKSDGRLGRLVALGYYSENALYTVTDYMSYGEMNQFFTGYSFGYNNDFKTN